MDSIYPVLESGRLLNTDDYKIECENIKMIATCYFIEVDLYIPEDLAFIPISVKNKDGLACFVHGYIKNVVINHCDYDELLKFGIYCKKIH